MTNFERELVNACREAGMGAYRLGGSGSGTDEDRADVIVGQAMTVEATGTATLLWLIEHKTTSAYAARCDEEEIAALRREAERWGGQAFIGARFKGSRKHYLVRPNDARRTDSGNYSVPKAEAADMAMYVVNATDGTVRP